MKRGNLAETRPKNISFEICSFQFLTKNLKIKIHFLVEEDVGYYGSIGSSQSSRTVLASENSSGMCILVSRKKCFNFICLHFY